MQSHIYSPKLPEHLKKVFRILISFLLLLIQSQAFSQVGISTSGSPPDPSAMLDIKSTDKGMLTPRVALIAIDIPYPIVSPATGLHIYNTDTAGVAPNNVFPGDYYWNGSRWIAVSPPHGKNPGDMLYWNGVQWAQVPAGVNGQVLFFSNGTPIWGQFSGQIPAILTTNPFNITEISATSGGNVSDGGSVVTTRGLCWSKSPSPETEDSTTNDGGGVGVYTSNLAGLEANTNYYIRAYASNAIGTGYGNELAFRTAGCELPIIINHTTTGGAAPVNKTVTYKSESGIPGEPLKCWITSNLGAGHQAYAVNDSSEASAGWYWQFNRKQGFQHDGTTLTPNTTWVIVISENLDWQPVNDPCLSELGAGWRIPTKTEWINVSAAQNWINWQGPFDSKLKLHAAGFLGYTDGALTARGNRGVYWSSTQSNEAEAWFLTFYSELSGMDSYDKEFGFSVRCVKD